jgi:hypothetical protein
MATKRTKPEAPAAKAAKPAPKRKVSVGPAPAEKRATKAVAIPTVKAITPPAPKAKLTPTRKAAPKAAAKVAEKSMASLRTAVCSEMVALRAYFIGQRRQELGQPGDSTTDWLEAEKQLRGDAGV